MISGGEVYVQFDLEYSRFEKNEKKLKENAQKTALNIEKNWETVGKESASYYTKMADAIVAEHNRIMKSDEFSAAKKAKAYSEAAMYMRELNTELLRDAERVTKTNNQNAEWHMAKMREQAAEQSRLTKQTMAEERAMQVQREANQRRVAENIKNNYALQEAYWKRNTAAKSQAENLYRDFWAKRASQEAAATEKSNKANADWWMSKRRYDQDIQKQEEKMWDDLGIKSKASINQRKKDVTESYNNLLAHAKANGESTERLHRAHTNKMKSLDAEYAGAHNSNMKGMIRNVLSLYAAYYVLSNVLRSVVGFFADGLQKADEMKKSAIAVAATIASQKGAENAAENYKEAYKYSTYLVEELRKVDKLSFANYEHILLMNRAMEMQGVHLDVNKKKQVEAFTALTNAIALYTGEQDKAKQASQEMRAIFTGNTREGSQVAKIIDTLAKQSGKYANGLKDIVKLHRQYGDGLERVAEFLTGINAAAGDIANTWEAATTSFETSWNRMKRLTTEALFPSAIADVKGFSEALDSEVASMTLTLREWHDDTFKILYSVQYLWMVAGNALTLNSKGVKEWSDLYQKSMEGMAKSTLDLKMKLDGFTEVQTADPWFTKDRFTDVKKVADEMGRVFYYGKQIAKAPEMQLKADAVDQYREIMRWVDRYRAIEKKQFDGESKHADSLFKLHQKQGKFELDNIKETSDKKLKALEDYKYLMIQMAGTEVQAAAKKAVLMGQAYDMDANFASKEAAITADYEARRGAVLDDRTLATETAKDQMVATEIELYKTVSAYSRESYNAQIADIERKFKAHHRYTKQSAEAQAVLNAALEKTKQIFDATFRAGKAEQRSSVLATTSPYSDEATKAVSDSIRAQADLIADSFNNQLEKEQFVTSKILDELATRSNAQKDYYDGLKGFEKAAYDKTLEGIELTRQAEILKGVEVKAANQKASQAIMAANERRFDAEHSDILKVMSATESMFGNAAALMAENSKEQKFFHNAEMAMKAAQIAIEVQKQIGIATGAAQEAAIMPMRLAMIDALGLHYGVVATVAQGTDPITGPARMAAMAAAVSGILAIAGIGFSVFGGSNGSSANPNVYNTGTGTLLGSEDASSSATKVAEILKDAHALEYGRLSGIYQEVKALNVNITGLVRGLTLGGDFSQMGDIGSFKSFDVVSSAANAWGEFWDTVLGTNYLADWNNAIWGGASETSQIGGGLSVSGTTMGDVLSGASTAVGQFFTDMKEVTDGGWFHGDKTKFWTTFNELDKDTNRLLSQVFVNFGNTMLDLADGFGVDITDALGDYQLDLGKIDLMGKTGDEITETLTAAFSAFGDEMVNTLFGSLVSQYQDINEGLLETAVRLMADKEQIMRILDYTNQGFDGTIESAIALSETLIDLAGGMDELTDAFSSYYKNFFSDSEIALDQQNLLSDSLAVMNLSLPSTREGFRALVESMDLTTASGQSAYVSLLQLAETADEYYSYVDDIQAEAVNSMKDRVSDWENALKAIQTALGAFTDKTAEAVLLSINDILVQTKQGILVSSSTLSDALSAATSGSTAGYSSGTAFDLDQARIRAALIELEAATSDQLNYDEIRLGLMERQTTSLEELVVLSTQTNGLLSGEVASNTPLTSSVGADNLIAEIQSLKRLIAEKSDLNIRYTKRTADTVEKFDNEGMPGVRS